VLRACCSRLSQVSASAASTSANDCTCGNRSASAGSACINVSAAYACMTWERSRVRSDHMLRYVSIYLPAVHSNANGRLQATTSCAYYASQCTTAKTTTASNALLLTLQQQQQFSHHPLTFCSTTTMPSKLSAALLRTQACSVARKPAASQAL
jgi:hypothetical protein